MENEIMLILNDEEMETYHAMGADPKLVILSVHRQILSVLSRAENIYAGVQEYDEKHVSQAIIDAGIQLSKERKELLEKRYKKSEMMEKQLQDDGKERKGGCPKKRKSM